MSQSGVSGGSNAVGPLNTHGFERTPSYSTEGGSEASTSSQSSQAWTEDEVAKAQIGLAKRNKNPNVRAPVLQALCMRNGIASEGTKKQMWQRLLDWAAIQPEEVNVLPADRNAVVLGVEVLQEVWDDIDRMLLPSCVAPAPRKVAVKPGKLKADEWRSLGMVHLVVTLVRLWGFKGGRHEDMLHNYMHLVSAVFISCLRSTTQEHINAYDFYYTAYLDRFLSLYPEVPLQPSNHLAQHHDENLEDLGPSHAVRAFGPERFNHSLQEIPTNMKSGELEMTMMHHANRAANVRPLLTNGSLPTELSALQPSFDKAFQSESRGTRLNDILGLGDAARLQIKEFSSSIRFSTDYERALVMNYTGRRDLRGIVSCSVMRVNGFSFRPFFRSHRDANILMRSSEGRSDITDPTLPGIEEMGIVPAQISRILWEKEHPSGTSEGGANRVFLIVRRHVPLDQDVYKDDPYRAFGFAISGCLFYETLSQPEIICAQDVVCPFASTPYGGPIHFGAGASTADDHKIHVFPIIKDLYLSPRNTDTRSDRSEDTAEGMVDVTRT